LSLKGRDAVMEDDALSTALPPPICAAPPPPPPLVDPAMTSDSIPIVVWGTMNPAVRKILLERDWDQVLERRARNHEPVICNKPGADWLFHHRRAARQV
jgi:hypothetical protein